MHLVSSFFRNVRQAGRGFAREKGFTTTALVTLALCLAANVVIFTVVHSVVLRPLPFPDPDRLVVVYNAYPNAGVKRAACSWPNYYERKDGAVPAFAAGAVVRRGAVIVGLDEGSARVPVIEASPGFLDVLGVPLAQGRFFQDGEEIYGKDAFVVLTDRYWRDHFHAAPDVVGQTIRVNEMPREIIGVLPPGFSYLANRAEFLIPLAHGDNDATPQNRHANNMEYIARLRPGVTIAVAQAQIDALNAQAAAGDPFAKVVADAGFHTVVEDLHAEHVAGIRPWLLGLQVGVFLLLLIGIVNLINLLLIRATARARELALRQVLGAGRGHIVAQVFIETLLLALGGAALGLGLGLASLRAMSVLGADQLPLGAAISFDGTVAVVALGGAIAVGLILALPVVWYNLHGDLAPVLNTESRGGTTTRATHRVRHTLIALQIAGTFMLLACAGLLGASFQKVLSVRPGFQPENVMTAQVVLPWTNYREGADRFKFTERLLEELRGAPGITFVGLGNELPMAGAGASNRNGTWVQGHDPKPGESIRTHFSRNVSGDYFQALGIPIHAGRGFNAEDARSDHRVCIVDTDFAEIYWPGESALGHVVYPGPPEIPGVEPHTIVGVVGSFKHTDLADQEKTGALFAPYRHDDGPFAMYVTVRTALAPETAGPIIRQAVARVDPRLPVDQLQSMEMRMSDTLTLRRSELILGAVFSGVALVLAAVGIYGVLAYAVAQRRREIGVRMALGALPEQVLRQFLALGARLLVIGILVGGLAAFFVGRWMQSMLFEISPFNGVVLGGTAFLLAVVVLLASYLPSRRAAHTPPIEALRSD